MYQYLLQPGEENDDQWHRATDRIWSKGTYRLREVVEDEGNHVMYYLSGGPERAFVSEELMLIPENTELPPDYYKRRVIFIPILLSSCSVLAVLGKVEFRKNQFLVCFFLGFLLYKLSFKKRKSKII